MIPKIDHGFDLPEDSDHIGRIISYINQNIRGNPHFNVTRIMKLYYHAELNSILKRGIRLSSAKFYNGNQGPYSDDIILVAEREKLDITVNDEITPSGNPGPRHKPSKEKPILNLEPEETEILDELINRWKNEKTAILVNHLKSIPPILSSSDGEEIDFDSFHNWIKLIRNDQELYKRVSMITDDNTSHNLIKIKTHNDIESCKSSL